MELAKRLDHLEQADAMMQRDLAGASDELRQIQQQMPGLLVNHYEAAAAGEPSPYLAALQRQQLLSDLLSHTRDVGTEIQIKRMALKRATSRAAA